MKGWRKEFESQLKDNFPGVSVSWNGNAPTLHIPDNLNDVKNDIVLFAKLLGRECGVVLQFGGSPTTHGRASPLRSRRVEKDSKVGVSQRHNARR